MKAQLIGIASALIFIFSAAPVSAETRPDPLIFEAEVTGPPWEVWHALTTPEGVTTFFAAEAKVESRIGGAYEMYFLLDNPPGLRGGEGVRILAMEEPFRFVASWNAPPSFGPLRNQQTVIEILLAPLPGDRTFVTMTHSGWGRGPDWQRVREYFASAWPVVLGRLQYRFDRGALDWRRPPDGAAYFRAANRASNSPGSRRSG